MLEWINQYKNPLVGSNILSITTGTFSKVENGYNNPSVDLLICLTKIFYCDFNAFFQP